MLGRLKDWSDQQSWEQFYQVYRRLILSAALKSGLTEPEAEDVLQETVLAVARTIKDFQYDRERCTFKSWLRHLTQKRIADQYRKRSRDPLAKSAPPGREDETPLLERLPAAEGPSLESVWDEEWRQKVFEAALERVKQQVSPNQYQIFDLSAVRKLPVKEVAALLEISVAQVYLARHRITRLVQKEARYLESRMG